MILKRPKGYKQNKFWLEIPLTFYSPASPGQSRRIARGWDPGRLLEALLWRVWWPCWTDKANNARRSKNTPLQEVHSEEYYLTDEAVRYIYSQPCRDGFFDVPLCLDTPWCIGTMVQWSREAGAPLAPGARHVGTAMGNKIYMIPNFQLD